MTCFLFTVILTTVFWLALMGYCLRRVLLNMRNNPEAAKAVTMHVIAPVFGAEDEREKERQKEREQAKREIYIKRPEDRTCD